MKDKGVFIFLPAIVLFYLLVLSPLSILVSWVIFRLPWLAGLIIPACILALFLILLVGCIFKELQYRLLVFRNIFFLIPCFCWVLVFVSYFVWWHLSYYFDIRLESSKIRFPLDGVRQIVIDKTDNIYLFSGYFNRLQVFDTDGRFVRGWFVNDGGPGRILQANDNGVSFIDAIDGDDRMQRYTAADTAGNSYLLEDYLLTRITKTTPDGEQKVVVGELFGLQIVKAFPGLFCVNILFFSSMIPVFKWRKPSSMKPFICQQE